MDQPPAFFASLMAQVEEAKSSMALRGVNLESKSENVALKTLHASLVALEGLVGQLQVHVATEKAGVVQAHTLLGSLRAREEVLSHLGVHFPERVDEVSTGKENTTPLLAGATAGSAPTALGPRPKRAGGQVVAIPSIPVAPLIRVSEFDAVPKYMKGRLTREQINNAVDILNTTVKNKYALLALPRAKMGQAQMDLVIQHKELEVDELAGRCFVVDADIKLQSQGQGIDRNIMTILRHVGRVTEHRSKGVVRHVIQVLAAT